ncbi:MAG: putative sulfate/molybdate transporter [Actinomycetota bacterium]|nr:putative sulfate/molybdate transporter [Actinomycetota bacterium]
MTAPTERASPRPNLLRELAGGVGDWGLLIPISIALVALNGLAATVVFAGAGLTYLATAIYFRVPVPVQPLKAFGAVAIAQGLSAEVIAAGALLMAGTMAALAITGAATWLAERFPLVLVRGIQAAVAMLLAKAALDLARAGNWEGLPAIDPVASYGLAIAACGLLFWSSRSSSLPGSLIVLAGGAAIGLAVAGWPDLSWGPELSAVSIPGGAAFATALTTLVLAQLPLTFGNSIVATADAEREYFGVRAKRVTPRRLSASIGLANGFSGLFGGLPVCHGAGGVTAHYKLGARTWRATAMAGAILLTLGLALGETLPGLLQLVPPGALAGMLMFVAIQHAFLAARVASEIDRIIVVVVGSVTLLAGNLAWGFAAGAVLLAIAHWLPTRSLARV